MLRASTICEIYITEFYSTLNFFLFISFGTVNIDVFSIYNLSESKMIPLHNSNIMLRASTIYIYPSQNPIQL
jgi:hypothetical protein